MLALIYRDKSNDYYVVHRDLVYLSVETLAYAGAWRYIIGDLKEKKKIFFSGLFCMFCLRVAPKTSIGHTPDQSDQFRLMLNKM